MTGLVNVDLDISSHICVYVNSLSVSLLVFRLDARVEA